MSTHKHWQYTTWRRVQLWHHFTRNRTKRKAIFHISSWPKGSVCWKRFLKKLFSSLTLVSCFLKIPNAICPILKILTTISFSPLLCNKEILYYVRKGIAPHCRPQVPPDSAPASYMDLMKMCWDERPERRPTFCGVLKILKRINNGK